MAADHIEQRAELVRALRALADAFECENTAERIKCPACRRGERRKMSQSQRYRHLRSLGVSVEEAQTARNEPRYLEILERINAEQNANVAAEEP